MATNNPFDLLGDDDAEDPSLLIAIQQKLAAVSATTKKVAPVKQSAQSQPAKLPSKPLPPAQAVKEARSEFPRGGVRGGSRGFGLGRGGYRQDEGSFGGNGASAGLVAPEEGDGGKSSERRGGYGGSRGGYRGGRRGGFSNGESDDGGCPRRAFERRSGTGRGNELKREGSGRGNWGTPSDELTPATDEADNGTTKNMLDDKLVGEDAADANKENTENEPEEKEPENKEMTLDEYEKLLEEKRKVLRALKTEERKVDTKQFETMQPLTNKKKGDDDVFIKLGSEKDKRKEAAEKDEKSKKSVSINEFLKPAEGEKQYADGRGRGRGRGSRGGYGGRDGMSAPLIEDPSHFPTLGGK